MGLEYGLGGCVVRLRIESYTRDTSIAGMTRSHLTVCVTRRLFNSENYAASAALAEVCALPSAVLV